MIVWAPAVLSVLYTCVLHFCICTGSAHVLHRKALYKYTHSSSSSSFSSSSSSSKSIPAFTYRVIQWGDY